MLLNIYIKWINYNQDSFPTFKGNLAKFYGVQMEYKGMNPHNKINNANKETNKPESPTALIFNG